MNLPRDREHDLEHLLGDDAGKFGAMYRRLSRVDPPRRLDRAVLGEAARAVHGQAPRQHRWLVGLGSAAGIVLAAGIAWQVGHDALREPSTQALRDASPMVVPVEPITERDTRRRERASKAEDAEVSTEAAPMAAPSPAPPPPPAVARRTEAKSIAPPRVPPAKPQSVPAPSPAVPFPTEAETIRSQSTTTAAPPADAAGAASVGAADASAPERSQRARSAAAPAPSSSAELRRDLQLPPDDWLAHVRLLLDQGRRQQAGESLRLFRRVHPDRPIPDDLRVLLD